MKTRTKAILIVATIVAVGLGVFWLRQSGLIDLEATGAWVEGMGVWGMVLYGLLYVVLGMLGLSKVAMTVLAGALFSFTEAMIITVLASTVAAVLGFLLARHFNEFISRRYLKPKDGGPKPRLQRAIEKIESSAKHRTFYAVAVLRLSLVPLMFLSYASGMVEGIRPAAFTAAIFITNIYMNFIYIFVGASITESLPLFAVAVVALVVFMQTPKVVRKFNKTQEA